MENVAAPSQEEQGGAVEEVEEKSKKGVPYEQIKIGVVKETTAGERRYVRVCVCNFFFSVCIAYTCISVLLFLKC